MAKIVIALGGNALGNNPEEQKEAVKSATPSLVGLIKQGHDVIISHGNGPQVGMIKLAFDTASSASDKVASVPLPECTAMSQGYIGAHLQNAILTELRKEGIDKQAVTVVTQVEVSADDPAFQNPTKPIGAFYDEAAAKDIMAKDPSMYFAEDAGRGWRQMVPSPKPTGIVERDSILNLVESGYVVVACGGGGVPVVKDANGDYEGVPAVIDKDFASAKLAELVEADYLFILTAVDRVAVNWGTPEQKDLEKITVAEAEQYCSEGHFAPGSMLPKVQAAMSFASSAPGRKAVIASLEKAPEAVRGESGTEITK